MKLRSAITVWPYSRFTVFEFGIVAVLLGLLASTAAYFAPFYISIAYLTEPVGLTRGLQTHLIENAALTGHWDSQFDYYYDSIEGDTVQQVLVMPQGHIAMNLASKSKQLDQHWLGFELFQYGETNGYKMLVWRCGTQHANQFDDTQQQVITTISPLITRLVCR